MVKLLVRSDAVIQPDNTGLVIVTDRDEEGRELRSLVFVVTRRDNDLVTTAVYETGSIDEFFQFASREGSGIELPPANGKSADEEDIFSPGAHIIDLD